MKKFLVSNDQLKAVSEAENPIALNKQLLWIDGKLSDLEAVETYLSTYHHLQLDEVHRLEILSNAGHVYFDSNEQYHLLVLFTLSMNEIEFKYQPLILIYFDHVIITLRVEEDLTPLTERLSMNAHRKLLVPAKEKILYAIVSFCFDSFTQARERLNRQFLQLRQSLFSESISLDWLSVMHLQDNLQKIAMQLELLMDVLDDWEEVESEKTLNLSALNLTHIQNRFARFEMHFQLLNNKIESLLNFYYAKESNQTNNILRVLTVLSTVFLPLMFLTSFFGMNFEFMPFLHSKMGFYSMVLAMFLITLGLYVFTKQKKWI